MYLFNLTNAQINRFQLLLFVPNITFYLLYCCESRFIAKVNKNASKFDIIDNLNGTYSYLDYMLTLVIQEFYEYTEKHTQK